MEHFVGGDSQRPLAAAGEEAQGGGGEIHRHGNQTHSAGSRSRIRRGIQLVHRSGERTEGRITQGPRERRS